MISPLNSQTCPIPKNNKPLQGSPISRHSYVTCHIVCQPQALPPWHRPPPTSKTPTPSNCRPPPFQEGKRKVPCATHTSLRRG